MASADIARECDLIFQLESRIGYVWIQTLMER